MHMWCLVSTCPFYRWRSRDLDSCDKVAVRLSLGFLPNPPTLHHAHSDYRKGGLTPLGPSLSDQEFFPHNSISPESLHSLYPHPPTLLSLLPCCAQRWALIPRCPKPSLLFPLSFPIPCGTDLAPVGQYGGIPQAQAMGEPTVLGGTNYTISGGAQTSCSRAR